MLLSIIVPVYNVEKYLVRCVDSLLDQGEFCDYEIILVDDGSTDGSLLICEDYSTNYDRIHVVHKENGGLSSARNAGIAIAVGEYVMFVDSDDYIKSESLGSLANLLNKEYLDVLIYNFAYVYDGYKVINNSQWTRGYCEVVSGQDYLIDNLRNNTMHMMACNKIYKKELITVPGVYFRDGYVHEDEEWTPRILVNAQRVKQVDYIIYGYYMRSESISNNRNNRTPSLNLLDNCKRLMQFTKTIKNQELIVLIENNIAMLCMSAFYKGKLIDKKEDIINICNDLHLNSRNQKKMKLLQFNPSLYILINDFTKKIVSLKRFLLNIPNRHNALKTLVWNKIRKNIRNILILHRQKKKLKNHSFSIISSSCNGGVMTSELGEQFRTPTVNLWFTADDFVKMSEHLSHYMSLPVKEKMNNFYSYPVGTIGDVTIYFMHYHSFEEAVKKWEERKKRINYDNLFFLMAEKDGCKKETILKFDSLPYKNKVIFTVEKHSEIKSSIYVDGYSNNNEVDVLTDFVGLALRKYDKLFNYVEWLNQ